MAGLDPAIHAVALPQKRVHVRLIDGKGNGMDRPVEPGDDEGAEGSWRETRLQP